MVKDRTKTAGQLSLELAESSDKYEFLDILPESFKDLEKKLSATLEDGIKSYKGDFFLVIESKRERLMQNILRNYIFHRISCPTPHYDQTAYHYDHQTGELKCLWSIPEKSTVEKMRADPVAWFLQYPEATRCVMDFLDGTLIKKTMEFDNKLDEILKELHG